MIDRAPTPRADVSVWLQAAARLFRVAVLKCLPLMMLASLCLKAADIYWQARSNAASSLTSVALRVRDPMYWSLAFTGIGLHLLIGGAVVLQLQALRASRMRPWVELVAASAARWATVMWASIIASAAVLLGLCLLLAPGIYLVVCLVPLLPLTLLEPASATAAIKRCVILVRPLWAKVLAALLIAALVALVFLIVAAVALALLQTALGLSDNAQARAVNVTFALLLTAALQLFFYCLALIIYVSTQARAANTQASASASL